MSTRYTEKFRDRDVRLLAESRENYSSKTKALQGAARNLCVVTESLRRWQERADPSGSTGPGESAELKRLRPEVAQLRCSNEILSSASAFLVQCSARHGIDGRVPRPSTSPVRGRADLPDAAGTVGWQVCHREGVLAGEGSCRPTDAGSP